MEKGKEMRSSRHPGRVEAKPSTSPSPGLRKVVVFGHPHCGTTILRSVIGHCERTFDCPQEKTFFRGYRLKRDEDFFVYKLPYMIDPKQYRDCHKIMILRNPLHVFSSLNKRFNFDIPRLHQVPDYLGALDFFDSIEQGKDNLYRITYEDMFINGHKKIKEILDAIGMKYTQEIFNTSSYKSRIIGGRHGEALQQSKKRNVQINKPFLNMNDSSKLIITDHQQMLFVENQSKIERHFNLSWAELRKVWVHSSQLCEGPDTFR